MPFSYSEMMDFYKENNLELSSKPFNNYLRFGGMPQRFDYKNEEDIINFRHLVLLTEHYGTNTSKDSRGHPRR